MLDCIFDLERRQKCLEDEIARVRSYCPDADLMISDLKRRLLYLKHELDRLHHADLVRKYLH